MKIKKVFKWTFIIAISMLALGFSALLVWSKTGTYSAGNTALSALLSSEDVTVTQDEYITLKPTQKVETGLIFYPGGLVEPAAYAPVLHQTAENGVMVVVTPMPFNLAIFNPFAANDVIEAYPHINKWFIAGHSLGGAAAAIYADNNSERIDGVAFWDSYPPDSADLSNIEIRVLSIYGTRDGQANTENFDVKRKLLPKDAAFVPIEGASHAQFGDYGPQKGDVVPSISQADQHQQITEIMLNFIFRDLR